MFDFDDEYDFEFEGEVPPPLPKLESEYDRIYCDHSWKPILLVFSTVFDCRKCGMKKEDYEKMMKNKDEF
jgi:hypothetical protein